MKFSRFPEGFSPSHFLFAEFFREIPTLFQKNFLCRLQKTKKRPLYLFSRRSERKKIRPDAFSSSLISEYVVFTEKQPRRITSAGLKCNRIFFSASVVHPWCKLVYGLVYERLF